MVNAPELSFRGAKRRGNLAVSGWITGWFRRNRSCLPEIAAAPSGPRNDKSGGIAPLNLCRDHCHPAWRSGSAATDAIGQCVFIGSQCESAMPSRDCRVGLRPPRNDKPSAFTVLLTACFLRRCSAGPGCPLPYKTRAFGTTFRFPVVLCGVFRYNRKGGTQIVKITLS